MVDKNEMTQPAFDGRVIRRVFEPATETWFFSVVDVVAALTNSVNPRDYWFKMKVRVKTDEGFEPSTVCRQFKMKSPDGKMRETDAADMGGILRIIQSIPSPKAEPFKLWLAKVGNERLKDLADPALALDRAREYWQRQGRSEKWIQQRMMGQETRNKLTDYWKNHEIKGEEEYALLTDLIHREWADVSVKDHKTMKGLKTQNLRDHMTEAELIFTALAELSTRQIAESDRAIGLEPNKRAGQKGGGIARKARIELEGNTGRKVVTGENFLPPENDLKKLGKAKGLPKRKK